jgi:dUTP pyrophosphatase
MITVKFMKMHPDAILPQHQTAGAAGFDLHAIDITRPVLPIHGCQETIRTGLAVEVPPGHVMLIFSRSGHGFNHDIRLANCVGVIDSDYRGEVKVRLTRDLSTKENMPIRNGDRIAQAMVIPVPAVQLVLVDELSETARGAGGFGSTGNSPIGVAGHGVLGVSK